MNEERETEIRKAVELNGKDIRYGDGYWEANGADIASELLAEIDSLRKMFENQQCQADDET